MKTVHYNRKRDGVHVIYRYAGPKAAHDRTAKYHGEVQGIVHSFCKETRRPYLVIRELSTRALVKCFFAPDMYEKAIETLDEPDGVVFVEGEVNENVATGIVTTIEATDFRPAPIFDLAFHQSFIGSRPNLTGDFHWDTTEKEVSP